MSADLIAPVILDLRQGRVRSLTPKTPELHEHALIRCDTATVVDATPIYESLVAKDDPVYVYEDHPCIFPPWASAAICYVNDHGNVIVMQATAKELAKGDREPRWETADPVDWSQVRWVVETFVWLGGRGGSGTFPTSGPAHMWMFAVTEKGEPADLHWVHLVPDYPLEHWDMAHLTLLGALNFCNCRNVELVDPVRPRAERRRLERLGVQVKTINVFPAGRSTRSEKATERVGTPLTSVRGHFAHYGPDYGRGLLFGKYAGRFWVPQYARGDRDLGEVQHDYRLDPTGRRT